MVTGWDRGFIIEKEKNRYTKKFTCNYCEHYDSDDKSCGKKGVFLPEIGYDIWKCCNQLKYIPYGEYSMDHIYQICKEGRAEGIKHISMRQLGCTDFYIKEHHGITYLDMKQEYYELLKKIYFDKSKISIEMASILVPEELLDRYKKSVIEADFQPYYEAIGAFVYNLGCIPGAKGIRSIAKHFHEQFIKILFNTSTEKVTLYYISCSFVEFFASWLAEKNVYEKYMDYNRKKNMSVK